MSLPTKRHVRAVKVWARFAKKAPAKKAPAKGAQMEDVAEGQWPLSRTFQERSLSQIVNNFFSGVRPGAFRRANEIFVGRLAMIGFLAGCVQEARTGKGILGQFDAESGFPLWETEDLLLAQIAIIAFLAFTGLSTGGQPFQELLNKEGMDTPKYTTKDGTKYFLQSLGLNTEGPVFGANANNELFLGRLAMIGFAVSVLLEATTDKGLGPLAQLGLESGEKGLVAEEGFFLITTVFFLIAAIFPAASTKREA